MKIRIRSIDVFLDAKEKFFFREFVIPDSLHRYLTYLSYNGFRKTSSPLLGGILHARLNVYVDI